MTNSNDIITLGCRLNAAESETISRLTHDAGIRDAVIVNSCAVTNEAVRTARQRIRRARRERPDARIIVTGCAAQTTPADFAAMAEVDLVVGNAEKLDAAQWAAIANGANDMVRVNDIMSVRDTAGHMIDSYGDRARAFLQVQNGCDHRCTFCIIPFGRGQSRSVPIAQIVEQAKRLVDSGHRELVLTGVDITSYGADLDGEPHLGALVSAILKGAPELTRLRLSSIDGAEIDDQLLELITGEIRIAPYLHLSLQSGDNMILKRMKRRHTRENAIDLCHAIRQARPGVAFGADIIAGFPTETDAMFANSLNIIDEAGLQYVHVFPFSPREGTPAARMPQLSRAIVKRRASDLREKAKAALKSFLSNLGAHQTGAILESGGRVRLDNFAVAHVDPTGYEVGALVDLTITGCRDDSLDGDIIGRTGTA